jgi:pyridoxal phosphate-dependent aminotransferase EpsN
MNRKIYLSAPHMGPSERELLLDAFDSNWVAPLGPHVDAFERELADVTSVPHVAALSSGTGALHLALQILGVGRGDRVWASTLTFCASVNPIVYVGAEPVFVDCDASWNLDPALLEEELAKAARANALPKAIISVDLYGQCADYDRILAAAGRYEIPVIEDAAEALGARYRGRPAGAFGEISALSFNGNKIITTGGGGAFLCRDAARVDRARFLATQARDPAPHYEHSTIGNNYRLSNLLAAVGRGQLRVLEERVRRKREIFATYERALGSIPGVAFMPEADGCLHTRWLTTLTIDPARAKTDREAVRLALAGHDVESRPVWKPMHLQPVYRDAVALRGERAARFFEHGLCLPSWTLMTGEEQAAIIDIVRGLLT